MQSAVKRAPRGLMRPDPAEIERAIDGIRKKGVIVDPIELNVVE